MANHTFCDICEPFMTVTVQLTTPDCTKYMTFHQKNMKRRNINFEKSKCSDIKEIDAVALELKINQSVY